MKRAELQQREQAIDAKSAELQGLHAQLIPLYNRLCSQLPEFQARCSVLALSSAQALLLMQSPRLIRVHPLPLSGVLEVLDGCMGCLCLPAMQSPPFSSLRHLPMQGKANRRLLPEEAGCSSGCAR